jgi:hypothetical protein
MTTFGLANPKTWFSMIGKYSWKNSMLIILGKWMELIHSKH